jgi:hypothetical protein
VSSATCIKGTSILIRFSNLLSEIGSHSNDNRFLLYCCTSTRLLNFFFGLVFILLRVWNTLSLIFVSPLRYWRREREITGESALNNWESLAAQCDRLIHSGLSSSRVSHPRSVALACSLGMTLTLFIIAVSTSQRSL